MRKLVGLEGQHTAGKGTGLCGLVSVFFLVLLNYLTQNLNLCKLEV